MLEFMNSDHNAIESQKFERMMIETIIEIYQAPPFEKSHAQFARDLFGDNETAIGKWHKIRKTSPTTGKPQNFTVSEAVMASTVLGLDFPSLAFRVNEKVKAKKMAT